jgi:hypothetical protein
MAINNPHPNYEATKSKWFLVRSVIDNAAQSFIRTVDSKDAPRSKTYIQNAILTNFTSLTKEGLTGLVFRRDPKIEIPDELQYLLDDAVGDDRGLMQLAKQSLGEVMITGRHGLLTDFPRSKGGVSIADTENLQAHIIPYKAENIINWNIERVDGKAVVKFIVLHEPTLALVDDFDWELKDKYRLLKLDDEGNYYQAIYDENLDIEDFVYPLDKNGNNLKEIPFAFVGSEDNNEEMDKAPLLDLATLNIGHYRNSADYEESVFVVGQPSLFVSSDWGVQEFNEALPNGIKIGARQGHFLGPNGQAMLLQANANQMSAEAMRDKLKQAAYIGARLISEPGGRETAEGVKIRFSSQNSALHTIVMNEDDAIEKSLKFCTWFMGGNPEEILFKLNREFYPETADPQLIAQNIMLYQNAVISREEFRDDLKQKNVIDIDKTDEEFEEELLNSDPFIGDVNANDDEQIN